ncbi:N-acetyltransferase family protein [Pradoshia sp.]
MKEEKGGFSVCYVEFEENDCRYDLMGSDKMKIRPANVADAPYIAEVNVESWRSTYKGLVPDKYLKEMSCSKRERQWRLIIENPNSIVLVAEQEDGRIIGYISGGRERSGKSSFEGELYAIYLLEDCQRKGIGKKLVKELVHEMRNQQISNMMVWVIEENPSKGFYESIGGKPFIKEKLFISGKELQEVGYGWPSLDYVTV